MLARYSLWGVVWLVVAGCFAVAVTLRFKDAFLALAPESVVYGVMGTLWAVFFLPGGLRAGQAAVAADAGAVSDGRRV